MTTLPVSSILANQALSGGKITSNGSDIVVERGVVVSTKPNPMVDSGDKTIDASGTGEFVILVKNLNPNTTYYIKAYAINSVGTAYGNEIQFSTNDVNLTRGLVAYYPFSGTAFDSSGNGNSGIVNGATFISNRFGLPNSALSFDGINDNV